MRWDILMYLLKGKTLDEEVQHIIDYMAEENRILRKQIDKMKLTDKERLRLSTLADKIDKKVFASICTIYKPGTVIGWLKKLTGEKETKPQGNKMGRPSYSEEVEKKVLEIARANRRWGYTTISSHMELAGYKGVSRDTVRRILLKHDLEPITDKRHDISWAQFLKTNKDVFFMGDFFTIRVLKGFKFVTMYVLFFIHLGTRKVYLGGITEHPTGPWLHQVAKSMTMDEWGPMCGAKYLLLDNDNKFKDLKFRRIIEDENIEFVKIPKQSPNLNAHSERWIQSIKNECLRYVFFMHEESAWYAIREYIKYYNFERPHQSMDNKLLAHSDNRKHSRLKGLLNYYGKDAKEAA